MGGDLVLSKQNLPISMADRFTIGEIPLQKVLLAHSNKRLALSAYREQNHNPILEIFIFNDERLFLKITNLIIEPLNKPNLKDCLDIYILSSNIKNLSDILNNKKVQNLVKDLDTQIRKSGDPGYNYNAKGKPLRIDRKLGKVKIQRIHALFSSHSYELFCTRKNQYHIEPIIYFDIEHNKTRLHLGGRFSYETKDHQSLKNEIYIEIPLLEYGHLTSILESALS